MLSTSFWTAPALPPTHVLVGVFDTTPTDGATQLSADNHLLGGIAKDEVPTCRYPEISSLPAANYAPKTFFAQLGVSYLLYFDLLNQYAWRVPGPVFPLLAAMRARFLQLSLALRLAFSSSPDPVGGYS